MAPIQEAETAIFMQTYKSDSFSDKGMKSLDLKKVNGKWLIVREYSAHAPVAKKAAAKPAAAAAAAKPAAAAPAAKAAAAPAKEGPETRSKNAPPCGAFFLQCPPDLGQGGTRPATRPAN